MRADLLLCNPYFIKDDPVTRRTMDIYPLIGHGYLASYLGAQGYAVDIFDGTFTNGIGDFIEKLSASQPAVVGVYGHVLSRHNAFAFAHAARERGMRVIAGGPDATAYCDEYLENGFEVVVCGEGEETAHAVMEWIGRGGTVSELHDVLGIAFRTVAGDTVSTDRRPYKKDIDTLPFPRRDREIYKPYMEAWRRIHGYTSMPVFASRGCPFDCHFCFRPVFGRHYRVREPEDVLAEIEMCASEFGTTHFRFVDDIFVVRKKWVKQFSRLVQERGLRLEFDILSRADLIGENVAVDLKAMGVRRVYLGMESGSDAVLNTMNKNMKAERSIEAAEIIHRNGMEFLAWILLGYPGEEKKDIYLTRDLVVKIKPDVLSISVAFPIKGTPFYDMVKDRLQHKRPIWRRTAENRLVFRGRYPNLFYFFARLWLHQEVDLAKGTMPVWRRPVHVALKWALRAGMEVLSLRRPEVSGSSVQEGGRKTIAVITGK